ncbi:MAG: sugar kinase [Silanimonas sp.]
MEASDRKIVLVTRRTRLQEMVARYNTIEQARFQAEHLGLDFSDFLAEDRTYVEAVASVAAVLERNGRLQRLDRGFLPNFLFPPGCLVVVIGQDGLVANTLKYLDGQPLLAVNPDPPRWDGVLLPFVAKDVSTVIIEALTDRRKHRDVTMARVQTSDGQVLRAVNDVFVGVRSHVSARYEIHHDGRSERHSSSGVIVSTGLGSTGWLRSVLTGAAGVSGRVAKEVKQLREHGFPASEPRLVFCVREPFPSKWSQAEMVFGQVQADEPLKIRSLMPENGVIFSDGIEADALDFRVGMEAAIGVDPRRGRLLL